MSRLPVSALRRSAALLLAGLLAACGSTNGPAAGDSTPPPKLTISMYSNSLGDLPALVADKKGFFKKHNVDVERINFQSGPAAMTAAFAGDLDLVLVTPLTVMVSSGNAGDTKKVLKQVWMVQSSGSWQLIANERVKVSESMSASDRLKALKGKTIGVPAMGSEAHLLAQAMFRFADIDTQSGVSFVAVGIGPSALAQFKQGQVDAMIAGLPAGVGLTASGGQTIYDMARDTDVPMLTPWPQGSYWATEARTSEKADALHRFERAMAEATAFIADRANADEVGAIWVKELPGYSTPALSGVVAEYGSKVYAQSASCAALDNARQFIEAQRLLKEPLKDTCATLTWSDTTQPSK
jgi:ABC-type nitrate/sulfonate/bicarbonate transport system substrate-binding protein